MNAPLRRLITSLGLVSAASLMADVTAVWTGAADDQFTNPANWQQVYVPATNATIASDSTQLQMAIAAPALSSGALDLGSAVSKLGGNTTFTEPVTVGSDVILAPGNSPGTMTFTSGLILASAGQLNFEVQTANGAAGTGYDLVRVSGGLLDITSTTASPFIIKVISLNAAGTGGRVFDFSSSNNYSWMLYEGNSASGINGFATEKFTLDLTSFTNPTGTGVFSLDLGTSSGKPAIFLNFTAVPEPSTYALLALGLGAAVIARRRRR